MSAWRAYRPALLLVVGLGLAILLSWGDPRRLDIILVIGTTGLLAVSLGLVYGQAGMLSVAQAALSAVGAYASAIATLRYGLPIWLGLLAAIALPAALAYVLARLIVRLSHLALAVATLLASVVLTHIISGGGSFTGGFIGIGGIPTFGFMTTRGGMAIVAGVMLTLAVLVVIHIVHSQQGRALRVIATDHVLAKNVGIDVTARLSAIFAVGGAIAGSAGWLYAHTRSYISPDTFPVVLSLEVIMMTVIGGKKTILGPVLGTVLLVILFENLPGAAVQGLFYGGALLLVLLVFPNGLLGTDWGGLFRSGGSRWPDGEPAEERASAEVAESDRSERAL